MEAPRFVEASSYTFPIGRVALKFGRFDKNNKMTQSVDIFLKFEEFYALYQGLFIDKTLSNQLVKYRQEKAATNSQYYKNVTIHKGGSRSKGEVRARQLKLQPGDKLPYIFRAEEGPGSVSPGKNGYGKGLIIPKGQSDTNVTVGFKHGELAGFMSLVIESMNAFLVAKETYMFKHKYGKLVSDIQSDIAGQEQWRKKDPSNSYQGQKQPNSYQKPNNNTNQNYNQNTYAQPSKLDAEDLTPSFDLNDADLFD